MKNANGMMVIMGNSVAELEQALAVAKMGVQMGATMGCGGSSMAEVEQAMASLRQMGLPCGAGGCPHCPCEDEDEYDPIDNAVDMLTAYRDGEMGLIDLLDNLSEIIEELTD